MGFSAAQLNGKWKAEGFLFCLQNVWQFYSQGEWRSAPQSPSPLFMVGLGDGKKGVSVKDDQETSIGIIGVDLRVSVCTCMSVS